MQAGYVFVLGRGGGCARLPGAARDGGLAEVLLEELVAAGGLCRLRDNSVGRPTGSTATHGEECWRRTVDHLDVERGGLVVHAPAGASAVTRQRQGRRRARGERARQAGAGRLARRR